MTIEQRRHIRFSLDIPAIRYTKFGDKLDIVIQQISIGGCLTELDENIYTGDEFRLLVQLPNKNYLPLACKAVYRSEDNGIGTKFVDITRFEQELLTTIISQHLSQEGLPLQVDPFAQPLKSYKNNELKITDSRRKKEEMLDKILSGENRFHL